MKLKNYFFMLAIFVYYASSAIAQGVAINTDGSDADASAMLDVSSTSKGLLLPRMTNDQRNSISNPAAGLMIFNTDVNILQFYNGSSWLNINLNSEPVATNVDFSGLLIDNQTLTGSYTYSDNESDTEGTSTFQWYRADDASGTNQIAISGETDITYVLTSDDVNKYISFEVTPIAQTGTTSGIPVKSAYQGSIINNAAPTASNVSISGDLNQGKILTGSYTYNDTDGDAEGSSTYQWYRADDASGTNQIAISGATDIIYLLTSDDLNKYISFEVTPIAQTGTATGSAVISSYQGSIATIDIGSYYQGGIVFYMDGNGGGLLCSITDMTSSPYGSYIITGASGSSVGDGQANTTAIINAEGGSGNYAAWYCGDYSYDGYSDWYLPSLGEVNLIYDNRSTINTTASQISGGSSISQFGNMWSSTESPSDKKNKARIVSLNSGVALDKDKSSSSGYHVRAVRSF